mmetsp:Transcript_27742/g.63565  ORF Transcript_27742/g.63565 Transcript_27742/m.63565 type:complete len:265 (-) Transcript_27742:391-1185(-)|eukprot:CAMPEP_0113301678 /NCGR_PEP_ID=MMETSP0010_2-20120614/2804_1 /TAXON_ID=216773 ORGANISM="Corethron hystrix, Strain 308" /NCGR_SAMPLE_ID=MMETSP0010_2 /ASSEMBLY_ACC=CAM_ASM_000155 /LENGTH=264 /DNA_ID=CAMNT_0000155335 /DNA_START=31 /DNA_END=825 /DNA_ORIENTATION=- /assembly_acc=CAM_ASM_000155
MPLNSTVYPAVFFLFVLLVLPEVSLSFQPQNFVFRSHRRATRLLSSEGGDSPAVPDEVQLLREAAAKLRRRAEEIEADVTPLRELRAKKEEESSVGTADIVAPVTYTKLEESTWKVRFRVRPDDNDENNDTVGKSGMRVAVSGEATIRLREDGYTDIVDTENTYFRKFWGWDVDVEEQDGKSYVVWSADAANMEGAGIANGTRLYFNCRLDRQSRETAGEDIVALSDGKITIKGEVKSGFWGVFNSSGILAEFRVRGDFVCTPV